MATIQLKVTAPTHAARLQSYIDSFPSNQRAPQMSHYPGLMTKPWHDAAAFPIVADLEAASGEISDEFRQFSPSGFHPEAEGIERTGSWDVLMLYERGYKNIDNCGRCPVTTRIVRRHAAMRSLAGLIYFSRLSPGTHIAPHRGPTNLRVRCHLALSVPAGDCAIRVEDKTRSWEPGRCLVFDDHFEHEAWNRTARDRVVLVVDLWHPDLSEVEIATLEGLHRYAAAHADSLHRYWAANARVRGTQYH